MELFERIEIATAERKQAWPTPQEYNEALQNLSSCFADPELQAGVPSVDQLGLPRAVSGAFASVYKVKSGSKTFAVRCFLNNIRDVEQRYEAISNFIKSNNLPYTVSFEYQRRGVLIRGEWFPILKMEWIEGKTLEDFVEEHLFEPQTLTSLLNQFHKMCSGLRDAGVAHGDLQHGNILVTEHGALRLVDYDGMFVPALHGWSSNELGHRNYQHPGRDASHFGPYLDTFAKWSIHVSLLALCENPAFYRLCNAGSDCLLLRRSDYEDPALSQTVRNLLNSGSADLILAAKTFLWLIHSEPTTEFGLDQQIDNAELFASSKGLLSTNNEDSVATWWTSFLEKQALASGSLESEKVLFTHPLRRVLEKESRAPVPVQLQPKTQRTILTENLWISAFVGILLAGAGVFAVFAGFAVCFMLLLGRTEQVHLDSNSAELIATGRPAAGTITQMTSASSVQGAVWIVTYEYDVPTADGRVSRRKDKYVVPLDLWDSPEKGSVMTVLYFEENISIPYKYSRYVAVRY